MNDWKSKLLEIKDKLPTKQPPSTSKWRSPTRKEVIDQKMPLFVRIDDNYVRKTVKKLTK